MKANSFFLLFTTFALFCLTQRTTAQNTDLTANTSGERHGHGVIMENQSRNAGFSGLSQFLNDSLRYPELARKNCIEGVVIVEATIGADGIVSAVKLTEGLGYGCDEAVLALVSKMPKWRPALKNGRPVEQNVLVPVRFQLQ